MLGEMHDILHEFPNLEETIKDLHENNSEFAEMMDRHDKLDTGHQSNHRRLSTPNPQRTLFSVRSHCPVFLSSKQPRCLFHGIVVGLPRPISSLTPPRNQGTRHPS